MPLVFYFFFVSFFVFFSSALKNHVTDLLLVFPCFIMVFLTSSLVKGTKGLKTSSATPN